jgi:hypothetical protein
VQIGAYGLATAVSIARFTGRNHFLSDALVGSAIGYGIGRYVYRTHHDPDLDTQGAKVKPVRNRPKLMPFVTPLYSRAVHGYGLALTWDN